MCALLRLSVFHGALCTGTDAVESEHFVRLAQEGYSVRSGVHPELAEEADLVVYTSAVQTDHPERQAAKREMERSVLLASLATLYPEVVAVAGTHGKTTVCGMLASILQRAGRSFSTNIGGSLSLGYPLGRDILLTEACEYNRHFLTLSPTLGVITGVEFDHPDCYRDLADVERAFCQFAAGCKRLICPVNCLAVQMCNRTYADMCIRNLDLDDCSFEYADRDGCMRLRLGVWGKYNMHNAAYAVRAARLLGIGEKAIKEGLLSYRGAKRRCEQIGTLAGVPLFVDYAHHPTEICAVLEEIDRRYRCVWAIFQPHTYSRTEALFGAFATCFERAHRVSLFSTYGAREVGTDRLLPALACCIGKEKCEVLLQIDKLAEEMKNTPHKKYGAVVLLGAGDLPVKIQNLLKGNSR